MSLAPRRPIAGVLSLWDSTVGKKFVMAITGIILFGYVVLHLWGNLKVFAGAKTINNWGVFLRVFGNPVFANSQVLWIIRVFLAACLMLHIVAAYQLTRRDWASRSVPYAKWQSQDLNGISSTYSSRTMRLTGVLILLFIIYHVLDLTTGTLHPSNYAPFQDGNIYRNLTGDFRNWFIALIYVLAVSVLGLHLYHAIWSFFQTLGLNNSRSNRMWRRVATVVAVGLTIGNIAIPVSVLTGIIKA
ncbi:MAG: succinate dehydrogenase cytochrome b subunit [Dehalococcoidia bacterium]